MQPLAVQPTETSPPRPARQAAQLDASGSSSGSIDQARFTPGTMLAERYRIVGLLGKGGMGEVYRADDLKLRQSVALKFLPKSLSNDTNKLERFHHEVRVARQVSHPNVCRVYDIAEADGQHFISMEYIDGEDLASVLRRMGKPSPDKAVQIARQLCAGLAAAHDKGVLHRDLKPHNIMIDGLGAVRVTDFGLAGFVEEFSGRDVGAGTPAYMAPEQLAGREVSVKSDVYSLGLVLYELFTGKRMFEGATREQIERSRTATETSTLSSLSEDLDPAIERIIQRCLETEPAARPTSALAVAAALPGGDPLAAALAAGETPSPRLVAGAGMMNACDPKGVRICIVLFAVGLAAYLYTASQTQITNKIPLPSSPEVLVKEARDLLAEIGYTEPPGDRTWGFRSNFGDLPARSVRHKTPQYDQLLADRSPAIEFWYRESPFPMVAFNPWLMQAHPYVPARTAPGMLRIWMSPQGTLRYLGVVPPDYAPPDSTIEEPDWTPLFKAARLDIETLVETEPAWTPNVNTDLRRAWKAKTLPLPGHELHVEAASFRGRPVFFRANWPWRTPPAESTKTPLGTLSQANRIVQVLWFPICLIGAILLARRNVQLGRADRSTATRLGIVVFASKFLAWLFSAHHVGTNAEIGLILTFVARGLLDGALVWVMYLAIEPYFRKIWPRWLVSWVRLFDGRLRDPLVGRDVLVGATFGVLVALLGDLYTLVPSWLGMESAAFHTMHRYVSYMEIASLAGLRHQVAQMFLIPGGEIHEDLIGVMMILLLRIVLRRNWLAYVGWVVLGVRLLNPDSGLVYLDLTIVLIWMLLALFVLVRFGLLALIVSTAMTSVIESATITSNLSVWYSGDMLVMLAVVALVAIYAVKTSLGGNSLFGPGLLDD